VTKSVGSFRQKPHSAQRLHRYFASSYAIGLDYFEAVDSKSEVDYPLRLLHNFTDITSHAAYTKVSIDTLVQWIVLDTSGLIAMYRARITAHARPDFVQSSLESAIRFPGQR
jgi:hypothetical protein